MGIKSVISKPLAHFVASKLKKEASDAIRMQEKTRIRLVQTARHTAFGKDHDFENIRDYDTFRQHVPVRDYEQFKPYIHRVKKGERDVIWPGRPLYLCTTSGTTSGIKYIPITKDSLPHHIAAARNALLCYIDETGNRDFVNGKMIFLQGNPSLKDIHGIPTGRLSGIVAHHVPAYLQKNRLPSFQTNCISDWETKIDQIVAETMHEKMTLISGIPPWVQMYFEKLIELSGKKTVGDIFPHFSLFVHGGVNFAPYKPILQRLIGREIDSIETYPASEGFIAFQDTQREEGLLLNVNSGMYFEFIPVHEMQNEHPIRLQLKDIETGENYALVLSSNAGLWAYLLGDTVRFVSTDPYRLIVSGRIKQFISAFGEHVIAEEVENALCQTLKRHRAEVKDFHVAPCVHTKDEPPYHEWFIEFTRSPEDTERFSSDLDNHLCTLNIYYRDLIRGKVLQPLHLTPIRKNGFSDYMKSIGKLGGQNKPPRLANDRQVAVRLQAFRLK